MVIFAFPTALEYMMKCLAIQTFTEEIRDSQMQQAVRLAHPKTLLDVLATALDFEAVREVREVLQQLHDGTFEGHKDNKSL